MIDFKELQEQLWQWQLRNFGPENPFWLATGVVEEVGELAHCLLKRHQKIRGGMFDNRAQIEDAVGDIMVYGLNLLSTAGVQAPPFANPGPDECPSEIALQRIITAAMLLHDKACSLDALPDSRELAYWFDALVLWLQKLCLAEGINFEATVKRIADEVLARDWKANPQGAGI